LKGGELMVKRFIPFILILVLVSFPLSGCYYFSAKNEIKDAEKLLTELKGTGGEKQVPYEYCSAETFLEAAKLEFSHNDFKIAKGFASRSKSASQTGLTEVKKK